MLERYTRFAQSHRRLSAGASLLGLATAIVGLSSVPADIEGWGKVFSAVGEGTIQWALVILGVAVMLAAAGPWLSRPLPGLPHSTSLTSAARPLQLSIGQECKDLSREIGDFAAERKLHDPGIHHKHNLPPDEDERQRREQSQYWHETGAEFNRRFGVNTRRLLEELRDLGHIDADKLAAMEIVRLSRANPGEIDELAYLLSRGARVVLDSPDAGHNLPQSSPRSPELSFGPVQMTYNSERIEVTDGVFKRGRILRVPVVNAQGAEAAVSVQVLLTFRPDDTEGWMSPRDPVAAEWDTDPVATTLDIPGNGHPQLFNVAFVLDEAHPCVFQWNRESRRAGLEDGYGIAGKGIVKVEVRGAGPGSAAPTLTDTLHIEALNGSLTAMWESEGLGARRNGVPWRGIPMMGPPPGSESI